MRRLGLVAALSCVLLLAACSGSGGNNSTNSSYSTTGTSAAQPSITSVVVQCSSSTVLSQQTSQCSAVVSGTGNVDHTVSWVVAGGGSIGATTGLFTAPVAHSAIQVTVTATSNMDATKFGSSVINVVAGSVNTVNVTCTPSVIQIGQVAACDAVINGTGSFSTGVSWTATGGTIDASKGLYSSATAGIFHLIATSQEDPTKTGTAAISVVTGVNNVLPIVVDAGPTGDYVNGAFATITVCTPGTTACQLVDHVLIDTGSVGLRLIAQGSAGGSVDPIMFPIQTDSNGNTIGECNQFVDGVAWGSVALATIQMAGESASAVPNSKVPGVPIQIIGDPRVPSIPTGCDALGVNEGTLAALGANGILGVGTFEQDCGLICVSDAAVPNMYYSCANGLCTPTFVGLAQQVTNPVWTFAADNNGVLIQLPSIPSGGTTSVSGSLIFGIGTQANNELGSANVIDTDANGFMLTALAGEPNQCSYIDSGSNAYFFSSRSTPQLQACSNQNLSFYCPASLQMLSAANQSLQTPDPSAVDTAFAIGNADSLFINNGGVNVAFSELGGPNAPINDCGSFDWGLPFFYGKRVFTGIEQQRVTGTTIVGPFWAY